MKCFAAALVLVLSLGTPALIAAPDDANPSPQSIAAHAFDVMAGPSWEKARYIAFTFSVEKGGQILAAFPQRLDRFTGMYRVEGKNKEGHPYVVVMNVNTKEGKAWLDGQPVADPKDLLTMGYRRFINDTYWLLVPLKMRDPGTHLEYVETKSDGGVTDDVVKLTFDHVGLTPGDQYWFWVNRKTGLIDRWEMLLESMKRDDPHRVVLFHDWGRYGGLLLSTNREMVGEETSIHLRDVVVSESVPAGAFEK